MAKKRSSDDLAVGIDFGGTGIKGAIIDLRRGKIVGDRQRVTTPPGASPEAVSGAISAVHAAITAQPEMPDTVLPVGVCMPSIVSHGIARTAANISPEWIDADARRLFTDAIGQPVSVANDADAAGVAESRLGKGRSISGSVLVITLGTGIGSALIRNGRLFPNTELGHIDLVGYPDFETHASAKVRERLDIPFDTWARTLLTPFFHKLEVLLSPDAFIVSGGVSKRADDFLPFIDIATPVHAAELRNNAGIVGAALLGHAGWDLDS